MVFKIDIDGNFSNFESEVLMLFGKLNAAFSVRLKRVFQST